MSANDFRAAVAAAYAGAQELERRVRDAPECVQVPLEHSLAELTTAFEELRVAQEELLGRTDGRQPVEQLTALNAAHYRALFRSSPLAYVTTDEAGRIIDASERAEHLFEHERPLLIGQPLLNFIAPDDRRRLRTILLESTAASDPRQMADAVSIVPPTGRRRVPCVVTSGFVKNQRGPTRAWLFQPVDQAVAATVGADRQRALTNGLIAMASAMITGHETSDLAYEVCRISVDLFDVSAAGVTLATDADDLQVAGASDKSFAGLEELQTSLGEGPCIDAFRERRAFVMPELDAAAERRWPLFCAAAERLGVRAAFSFPLCLQEQAVGALNLFRDRPGRLPDVDLHAARALADMTAIAILSDRALHDAEVLTRQLQHALNSRIVIEQAKGVLAARLGVEPDEAFLTLRRYARSHNLRLRDLAARVVEGGEGLPA